MMTDQHRRPETASRLQARPNDFCAWLGRSQPTISQIHAIVLRASPPKLAYIDAARGMAILGVIAVHCAQNVPARSSVLQYAMLAGLRGVQLFYLVSAITLCITWNRRGTKEITPIRNYFLRRFWRIAPLFYTAIGGYLLLYGMGSRHWAPNGVRAWFIPATVMMAHGWHPETINGIVPGSWSIAVEFTFYLILPIVLSVVTTPKRAIIFLAISMGGFIANKWLMPLLWTPLYPQADWYLVDAFTFFNFFSQLPVFAIGVVSYFAIRDRSYRNLGASLVISVILCIASTGLQDEGGITTLSVLKNHVVFSAALSVFIVFLSSYPLAVVVNPLTRFFGNISYGLYLTHFAAIEFVKELFPHNAGQHNDVRCIIFLLLVIAVSTVMATVANRLIEQPCITLGKRIISKKELLR